MAARHRIIDTPLGELTLVGEDDALTGIYYPGHWTRPDRSGFGPADPGAFAEAERQLRAYLAGERSAFSLHIRADGNPFQKAVWELIAAISYGQTRTYAELAAELPTPSHARAVGSAVAHNPLSIVIPCHRVVGRDGTLTGYAGGLERKRVLLELEGAVAAQLVFG